MHFKRLSCPFVKMKPCMLSATHVHIHVHVRIKGFVLKWWIRTKKLKKWWCISMAGVLVMMSCCTSEMANCVASLKSSSRRQRPAKPRWVRVGVSSSSSLPPSLPHTYTHAHTSTHTFSPSPPPPPSSPPYN